MEGLFRSCAWYRSLGPFEVFGPMLGREEPCITIRSIVAVGNEEGFHSSIIVLNGDAHCSLPNIVHSCATIAFDYLVGFDQVTNEVFADIGEASSAAVVHSKVKAISVERGLELDAIMRFICRGRGYNDGTEA